MDKSLNQEEEPDFDWLAHLYARNNAFNHPSELHGLLIGHLIGGVSFSDDVWFQTVCEHMGLERIDDAILQPNTRDYLQQIKENNEKNINSLAMVFQLLLPDDSYSLSERVEGIGSWARGFLEGVALSTGNDLASKGNVVQELLRDFVNISQIDNHVSVGEKSESEFMEVCEYVRIGVITLYEELKETDSDNQTDTLGFTDSHTLH